ncbi:hypothetical protein [Eubacterium sp.]|uniref:hypothetical protein n=1 Tax=Eubacterium sp. TaxID=142586 RepID=UPI003F73E46C
MKKFFRKSLACIIAIMMIATSLPFSAITAGAATTNTTIEMNAFGAFRNGTASRVGSDYVSTCNDGQNSNFVMAVFKFDISGLTVDDSMTVSAKFNYYLQLTQSENKGVSFYYPTKNLNEFDITNQYQNQPNTTIWSGDDSNHLSRAIDYYGLQDLQTNISISSTKTSDYLEFGPSILEAKKQGKSYAAIVGVIASAGQSGSTGGWTDTSIGYSSTTVNVTITDIDDKTYIDSKINSWQAPTAQTVNAFGTDTGIVNALYSDNTYIDNSLTNFSLNAKESDTKMGAKAMPAVGRIVYMYTGDKSVAKIPVVVETQKVGSVLKQYKYNYLISADSNWTYNGNNWYASTAWNAWDVSNSSGSDGNYVVSSSSSHDATDYSDSNRTGGTSGTLDVHNIAFYNGNISFSNGYMKLPNPTMDMSFDGWSSWTEWFTTYYSYQNNITKNSADIAVAVPTISLPDTASYYLIDFSEMQNMYSRVKSEYSTVSSNSVMYTDDSLAAYYNAVKKIIAYNPQSYDFSTDAGVQSCASDMQTVISGYNTAYNGLTKKTFTVSFQTKTNNIIENRTVEYGNTIGEFPQNTAAEPTILEGKHYEYSWPTTYTADTVVTSNITINENEAVVACTGTATCTARPVCEKCGMEFGAIDPDNHDPIYTFKDYTNHIKTCSRCDLNVEEAHTDDGTGKCQYCGHVLLDTSALDSAKTQANDILTAGNADGKYVADTYQNLSDVYNRIKDVVPTSEDEVNSLASELLEAISSLISASVTITFTKAENGTTVGDAQTITATYGDTVELTVSDADVEKWEIVNNESAENEVRTFVKTGENTLSIVVTENISVIAHLAENGSSQQNITKVVFMGRNNNLVAIKYIEPGVSFATSDVEIPAIPFYTAIAWDKTEVVGLENGGEITVRAQYDFNVADADAHKCGIHYDGFENKVRKYNYDSFVKLYGSSTYYGMYEDEANTKLLTYFKTDEFYAPHNSDIYVAPVDASAVTASVGVTGSYQENYDTKDVAAFNCKFFVPDDAKIVEWGIKANAGGTTYNFKSNNKTSRNEYTFKVNVAKAANISSVSAKAYIIYIDGAGNRTTLLSNNEVAINFN